MSLSADSGKQYHLHCTGDALNTVNAHVGEADITLFGSCFCPFVQRVWVAFEYLGISYHVRSVYRVCSYDMSHESFSPCLVLLSIALPHCNHVSSPFSFFVAADEVDPYKKTEELLQVSPKGFVPALKLHAFTPPRYLNESTVILEYLDEYVDPISYMYSFHPLHPPLLLLLSHV
jgi:glutathione S-transferase